MLKLENELKDLKGTLDTKRGDLRTELAAIDKKKSQELNAQGEASMNAMLNARESDLRFQYQSNADLIAEYQRQLGEVGNDGSALQKAILDATGVGPAVSSTTAKVIPDYWTSISASISKSSSSESSSSSSTSTSVDASASFGLWSVGGSASHAHSAADAMKEMANSNVKISFDCMRVDINRSWLRPELFYDHDLKPASGEQNVWVYLGGCSLMRAHRLSRS